MSHPDLLASQLGEEEVVARITLSGEDELVITPSRSLHYQAEGLLSDESVTSYPHDVESVTASRGRRKASIEFTYPIEDPKSLSVPKSSLDSAVHYIVAGILNAKGVTDPGESVSAVYRFNELTVVVTSKRLVTHVGEAVWDAEHDQYRYADLTGLDIEEGSVATQIVLYIDGRSQRIKVPKERGAELKQDVLDAVFGYFDVSSMAALEDTFEQHAPESEEPEPDGIPFDDAVEPLRHGEDDARDTEDTSPTSRPGQAAVPAEHVAEIESTLERLQETIDAQSEVISHQQEALDELITLLREDS